MTKLNILALTLLYPMLVMSAHARSPENVFVSGKVLKGDSIVTSFAAPILLGGNLPVNDTERSGVKSTIVKVDLSPQVVDGDHVTLLVKVYYGVRTSLNAPGKDDGHFSEIWSNFNKIVEIDKGGSKTIPFGLCTPEDEKANDCTHKLVVSVGPQ